MKVTSRKRHSIRRRDVLRAAGGTLVGLPWLEGLLKPRQAVAQASDGLTGEGHPKRLLVFFRGNGVYADEWFPTPGNTERDFTLNRTTQPLAPVRDKLLFLDGVDNHVVIDQPNSPGEAHQRGTGSILTGWELNPGDIVGADNVSTGGYAKGPSFDQLIAKHIGANSPIQSLQVGTHTNLSNELSRPINYAGNNNPIQSQHDPAAVFEQVFAQRGLPSAQAAALRSQQSRLLQFTTERYASVARVVSGEDKLRLAEHAEHLSNLEKRVRADTGRACGFTGGVPGGLDPEDQNNTELLFDLHRDMLVRAFSCNLTQVGTLMAGNGQNKMFFNFLDDFGGDHFLAHGEQTDQEAIDRRRGRHMWTMRQFRDVITALDAVPEGNGTLLDSTVVFFCSENTNGWHLHSRHPMILAGDLGGTFDVGRLLQLPQRPSHTQVLVSLMNAFGLEGADFGNPQYNMGPLAGLTV